MGKDEFLKEARKMGINEKLIAEIVEEVEEDIASGLPIDWKMYLIEPVINPISDDLTTPAFGRWWFFHTIFAVSRWWAVNRTGKIVVPNPR